MFTPICYEKEENRTEAIYNFLKVRNSIKGIIRFSFCFIVKYFRFETVFVEFNYVVKAIILWRQGDSIQNLKRKEILYIFYICLFTILFYLRKVFILVHLKQYCKIYFNYVIQFVTDFLFKKSQQEILLQQTFFLLFSMHQNRWTKKHSITTLLHWYCTNK